MFIGAFFKIITEARSHPRVGQQKGDKRVRRARSGAQPSSWKEETTPACIADESQNSVEQEEPDRKENTLRVAACVKLTNWSNYCRAAEAVGGGGCLGLHGGGGPQRGRGRAQGTSKVTETACVLTVLVVLSLQREMCQILKLCP